MDKMIIKGAGTIAEICNALHGIQATFGKDATLTEVETAAKFGRTNTEIRKFYEAEEKKHD
jgi:hypothetical protein